MGNQCHFLIALVSIIIPLSQLPCQQCGSSSPSATKALNQFCLPNPDDTTPLVCPPRHATQRIKKLKLVLVVLKLCTLCLHCLDYWILWWNLLFEQIFFIVSSPPSNDLVLTRTDAPAFWIVLNSTEQFRPLQFLILRYGLGWV